MTMSTLLSVGTASSPRSAIAFTNVFFSGILAALSGCRFQFFRRHFTGEAPTQGAAP
jgi:hypothetical protein